MVHLPQRLALRANKHLDVDYKTFSRRTVGNSKILERIEGALSDF